MNLHTTHGEDGICLLTFDKPDSSANLFDSDTLSEVEQAIDTLAKHENGKGLIFLSAKPSIFIAGADLKVLSQQLPASELDAYVERGQRLMQKVADLPFPTVAAIHGACLGGGFELALACDYRIATPDHATKIGLPETRIGILPAWGGSTRLPRLIGLPKALDIILAGKTPPAKLARKLGMIDGLAPRESLEILARRFIAKGKPTQKNRFWLFHAPPGRWLLTQFSRRQLQAKTRGNYPALWKALDVTVKGTALSIPESLQLEKQALLTLAKTSECQNLMRVFFLTERAKHLKADEKAAAKPVNRAAVIGAGTMGAGIAQWISSRGPRVLLKDVNAPALARGMSTIEKLYADAVRHHVMDKREARDGRDRVDPAAQSVPMQSVDIVIEAALEEMALKQKIFAELERTAGPDTVLATNTSALSIQGIGDGVKHPERLIGLHFFNPVHRMQLVEVITAPKTSAETQATALRFVQKIGKLPVLVRDSPGFLVNRMLMPYLLEAVLLFEEGHSMEQIDNAMLTYGMPMGPLRLIDEVGHDIARHVARDLSQHFQDHMAGSYLLDKTVEKGWLGKKTKRGFYLYDKKNPVPNPDLNTFITPGTPAACDLTARMLLPMLNEAARCLEENVSDHPQDIDFAMIMGTGFAPFRGGPLRVIDALGTADVVKQLEAAAADGRPRYAPCELLRTMAAASKSFYPETTP